ncbi:MAG: glutamate-cysteine ligase family protein [Longimicrobiales bacterium]|nr:glutamate-cysteine ligase family protein [Longimicrobiales bacterium]
MDHRRPGALRPGGGEPRLTVLAPPDAAALLDAVRTLFTPGAPGGVPLRAGVEAEFLPLHAADGRAARPREATLPVLEALAARQGWTLEATAGGLPRFHLGAGDVLSYEPGGQLEYASPALPSLEALDRRLHEVLLPLAEAMATGGVRLLARGMDPANPLADARLVLAGERYPRQRAHYDRRGPAGRTMMLQSAALHLNLDFGGEPGAVWDAANVVAPHLIALFANSPHRHDEAAAGPHRSHRAALWRTLDPTRNAVFAPAPDPVSAYLDFALDAESFLLGDPAAPSRPFREWLASGATREDFARHLTTLFPEVRPRTYLELRSVDSLPLRWCVVPAAVVWALLHHVPTRARVLRELPAPDTDRLLRAGRAGVGDPALGPETRWLGERVLEGLHGLGPQMAPRRVVARVEAFLQRFTGRGADPGSAEASFLED